MNASTIQSKKLDALRTEVFWCSHKVPQYADGGSIAEDARFEGHTERDTPFNVLLSLSGYRLSHISRIFYVKSEDNRVEGHTERDTPLNVLLSLNYIDIA